MKATYNKITALGFTLIASIHSIELQPRTASSCAYLVDRIYCLGGDIEVYTDSLIALDISKNNGQPFQNLISQWVFVKTQPTNISFESRAFPQAVPLPDGKSILIQGGCNYGNSSLVDQSIVYNAETNSWSTLANYYDKNNGGNRQIFYGTGVMLHDKNAIGFYGGSQQHVQRDFDFIASNGTKISKFTYEDGKKAVGVTGFHYLTLLDLNTNTWNIPQQSNVPVDFPLLQSAIYHPGTKKIFYLGGNYNDLAHVMQYKKSFTHTITFDTINGQWRNETLSGPNYPTVRQSHTSSLLPNGQNILLYGGESNDDGLTAPDYFYTVNVPEMKWIQQNLQVPAGFSVRRSKHSAVLVKNTSLFVLFGLIEAAENATNRLLILDVRNASNITFADKNTCSNNGSNPSTSSVSENSSEPNKGLGTGAIVGIAVGCCGLGIAFIIAIIFFTRKPKKDQSHPMLDLDWEQIEKDYYEKDNDPPQQSHHLSAPAATSTATLDADLSAAIISPDGDLSATVVLPNDNISSAVISPDGNTLATVILPDADCSEGLAQKVKPDGGR